MYPRSTSVARSSTRTFSPTSSPSDPRTTRPSTGGWKTRTHVPLSEAPVTIASNRSPIRDSRSIAAADLPKKRLGLEYAQINVRVYPDQSEAFSTAGWALYRLGRIDEAEANLRKSATMARTSPDAFYFLARIAMDRGRKDEAKMFLQVPAIKTQAPYFMRKEVEALQEELSGR